MELAHLHVCLVQNLHKSKANCIIQYVAVTLKAHGLFRKVGFPMWLELSFFIIIWWGSGPGLFNCISCGLLLCAGILSVSHFIYVYGFNNRPPLVLVCICCLTYSCHKGELQDKVFITAIAVCLFFSRLLKWTEDNMETNTHASEDRNEMFCFEEEKKVMEKKVWSLMISTWKYLTFG